VAYTNAELQMPPKKKLGDRAIADLARWIKSGAPWPGSAGPRQSVAPGRNAAEITDQDRPGGPFNRSDVRVAGGSSRAGIRNPIDAFVFAQLEAKGLTPNPAASRRELIRRAYFDLIGLPPAPRRSRHSSATVRRRPGIS